MAYRCNPSSHAFRFPREEMCSSIIVQTIDENSFHDYRNLRDSESSSTMNSVTDSLDVLKLPTRLIVALTCGFGGTTSLQLIWSTLFSHGTAYIAYLGISKSQSSLIWAIGPVCGAIVQPIVGAIADNSQLRLGRRRPFILGGAVGTVLSLIALAWVSNIMRALAAIVGVHSFDGVKSMIQFGIVVCITLLNFSIQPLQSGLRSLIVDVCPPEQQSIASAWAGRFVGLSNILGYILGSLPPGYISNDNEAWKFRFLSLVSVAVLVCTVLVTVYFIREEDPREFVYEPRKGMVLLRILQTVKGGWLSMPPRSQRVCLVQFFAWMGWFGFLFYSTSYVGRLYIAESQRRGIEHFYLLRDAGIRLGTFANLLSAVMAFVTMVLAPYVTSTNSLRALSEKSVIRSRVGWWRETNIVWAISHLLYAFCSFCMTFVSSTRIAIFLIALTGMSWGITQWAPFAILGEEIAMSHYEQDSDAGIECQQWISSRNGSMLGVHNAAISVPQILAALSSSFIFVLFKTRRSGEDEGIVWVLRTSGVAALIAAYFAWRLKW
ncbi:putative sucrose transport protein [Talaromyces proteolyticus]|uniref:Sucrose transport protein n=1 Tax=Talaromyces proteolyticus TaxID=1131652 RepID=A0AAD4L039_9EURO|nr:putative sucrose transport protein [Talaromyces proteolyticus]KAH8703050.1 putative sucrose transport protein [Talaromyces proteolyticus]